MNKRSKKSKAPSKEELLRLEVAEELGLLDKINQYGWGSLNAKEAGKIGGTITQMIKKGVLHNYKAKNPSR